MAYITLFIKNENEKSEKYHVHGEHECDFYDFIKNHSNKIVLDKNDTSKTEWVEIELTSDDVKTIKETAWYPNTKWDNPQLDDEINEGGIIEALIYSD